MFCIISIVILNVVKNKQPCKNINYRRITMENTVNTNVSEDVKEVVEIVESETTDVEVDEVELTSEPSTNGGDLISVEIPFDTSEDNEKAKTNLLSLIGGKASLIKQALGDDGIGKLPVNFGDNTVTFNWVKSTASPEVIQAWQAFIASAVKAAHCEGKFTAKDKGLPENEKFAMRALCIKVGLKSNDDKPYRKVLMQNLTGDSAFATPESKAKWVEKHQNKDEAEVAEVESDE
jgi:hypothetical protein